MTINKQKLLKSIKYILTPFGAMAIAMLLIIIAYFCLPTWLFHIINAVVIVSLMAVLDYKTRD